MKNNNLNKTDDQMVEKQNDPDKRDAAEKLITGEVNKKIKIPTTNAENPGDVGPNISVPSGSFPDKPAK